MAPGVEHIEIRRGDFSVGVETDRWTIHALILDPARVRLTLGRAMDEGVGTEVTSSIAARHGALAAVNGGYFRTTGLYRGEPAGLIEVSGQILSEPEKKRPGLAVADIAGRIRTAMINVDFQADVVGAGGRNHHVDGVNRPRSDNELILFTPEFHRTTLTRPDGVEAVVMGGLVVAVGAGRGSQAIPENGFVISAAGKAGRWVLDNLQPGGIAEIRSRLNFDSEPPWVPEFVLGGGPILVRGGRPAAASDPGSYDRAFSEKRHPRTAAGVRSDGTLVLITVDGRHPATSVGMTIAETTALMIEFGCIEAINLDGGGSTTMVIRNTVVNSPSDLAGERSVSDALLVFLR